MFRRSRVTAVSREPYNVSRYSHYSELLKLNLMLLRNMMLYWTGSVETATCISRIMELPEVADNSPRVASGKQHGTVQKYIQFSDLWIFRMLHLESYSSKKQAFRNTKIGTRSAKGLYYWRKSPPTSSNLYVRCKRVRLYLLSEYTLLTLFKSKVVQLMPCFTHDITYCLWWLRQATI